MDSEDEFDSEVDRIPTMMRTPGLTGFQMRLEGFSLYSILVEIYNK